MWPLTIKAVYNKNKLGKIMGNFIFLHIIIRFFSLICSSSLFKFLPCSLFVLFIFLLVCRHLFISVAVLWAICPCFKLYMLNRQHHYNCIVDIFLLQLFPKLLSNSYVLLKHVVAGIFIDYIYWASHNIRVLNRFIHTTGIYRDSHHIFICKKI